MDHSTVFIKKVSSVLEESFNVPMWGHIPPFPWDVLCSVFQKAFDLHSFSLSPLSSDWKEKHELLSGLGDHPSFLALTMTPLAPPLFWVMGLEDVEKLTRALVDKEGKRSFADPDFQKGFFRFSMLSTLKLVDQIKIYPGLTCKMGSHPLTQDTAYCVDVKMSLEEETLLGRLVCPAEFHRVFTSHFSSRPFSLDYIDSSLELTLHLQVGKVILNMSEWEEVSIGDLVVLDQCSYNPTTQQGSISITLGTTALFIAKRKNYELKILDYALYEQEEDSFMMENTHDDDEEEMFSDEEGEEEEFAETEMPVEEIVSAHDVPLSLCVEVAHIKMSLKELLHLKPGNTLQLPVSLEQGVNITLNSKTVARGQLLQIGDLLGVKISEISH
jgi:flagellar motor switch protein FliN